MDLEFDYPAPSEAKDTAVLEQDWLDSILDDLEPAMDTDSDDYSPPSSPPELDVHSIDSDSSDEEDEDDDVTTPLGPDFTGDTYFFSNLPLPYCTINRAAAQ